MITRTLASELQGFKIRSNRVISTVGEFYGCYSWTDLGDTLLLEYRLFSKKKGVFPKRKSIKSLDEILDHIDQCPAVAYKIWSKDKKHATKWCKSIEEAYLVKKMIKQKVTKATDTHSKQELHLEDGVLWVVCYERTDKGGV
jgi:hypothetical protein